MFKVVCPHCKREYECEFNEASFHAVIYKTSDGKDIVTPVGDDITECPDCKKEFRLNEHSADCGEVNDGSVAES